MNGIFSRWQPRYAEHGIATVPVDPETKIARMQWQKVGLPASAKMAQQPRYAAYNGIGFACGKRNRITVLDIDSTDERLLSEALARHGDTPIVERTASGKFHAFYRHNEESRSCRQATGLSRYQKLWGADVPIDLLGAGLCVATPTLNSRGSYEFIRGSLADIPKLPTMGGWKACGPPYCLTMFRWSHPCLPSGRRCGTAMVATTHYGSDVCGPATVRHSSKCWKSPKPPIRSSRSR